MDKSNCISVSFDNGLADRPGSVTDAEVDKTVGRLVDEAMEAERERGGCDCHGHRNYTRDDCRLIFREAVARLAGECGREVLEALVRFVLLEEDRSALAREYGYKSADGLSVLKTRWLPRLTAHVRNVVAEDAKGALQPAPAGRTDFLRRFVKWL